MKKQLFLLLFAGAMAIAIPHTAMAQPHVYIMGGFDLSGGYDDPLNFLDRLTLSGGVDVGMGDVLAAGGQVYYQHASASTDAGDVSADLFAFMGNVSLSPAMDSSVAPFVGAGAGIARASAGGPGGDVSDTGFAFHGYAGARFGHFLVQGDFMHVSGDFSGNSFYAFFGVRF